MLFQYLMLVTIARTLGTKSKPLSFLARCKETALLELSTIFSTPPEQAYLLVSVLLKAALHSFQILDSVSAKVLVIELYT